MFGEILGFAGGQAAPSFKHDSEEGGLVTGLSDHPSLTPYAQDSGKQQSHVGEPLRDVDVTVRRPSLFDGTESSLPREERDNGADPGSLEVSSSSFERKVNRDVVEEEITASMRSRATSEDAGNASQNFLPTGSCSEEPTAVSKDEPNTANSPLGAAVTTDRKEETKGELPVNGEAGQPNRHGEGTTGKRDREQQPHPVQRGSEDLHRGSDHEATRQRESGTSSSIPCVASSDSEGDSGSRSARSPLASSSLSRSTRSARDAVDLERSVVREDSNKSAPASYTIDPANACINSVFYCSKRKEVVVGVFDTTKVVVTPHVPDIADQAQQGTARPLEATADRTARPLLTAPGTEGHTSENENRECRRLDDISLRESKEAELSRPKKQRRTLDGEVLLVTKGTATLEEKVDIYWMSFTEARGRYWKALAEFLLSRCRDFPPFLQKGSQPQQATGEGQPLM